MEEVRTLFRKPGALIRSIFRKPGSFKELTEVLWNFWKTGIFTGSQEFKTYSQPLALIESPVALSGTQEAFRNGQQEVSRNFFTYPGMKKGFRV